MAENRKQTGLWAFGDLFICPTFQSGIIYKRSRYSGIELGHYIEQDKRSLLLIAATFMAIQQECKDLLRGIELST